MSTERKSPRVIGDREEQRLASSITTSGMINVGTYGGEAEVKKFSRVPGEYEMPPLEGHVISLRLNGSQRVLWRFNERTLEGIRNTGHIAVIPAAKPFAFVVEKTSEDLEEISVTLKERFFERVTEMAGANPDQLEILDKFRERDERVRRLLASFVPEMEGEGLGSELYVEALVTQLAVHLLRYYSSLGRRDVQEVVREPAGSLSNRAISQSLDYLNDNLAGRLSLKELAGVSGYSPYHFTRLFREATGHPPHRYVIRQRVEKACGLLTGTELPLAEVAHLCGFSGQSHMGKNVRALTGSTPARLRQEARR